MVVTMSTKKNYFNSVRKKDGNIVKYQKIKLLTALSKSAKTVGIKDKKLILRIVSLVERELMENYLIGETVTTTAIRNCVEKILKRENLTSLLEVYRNYNFQKEEMHKKMRVAKKIPSPADATDISLLVSAPAREEILPWDHKKISEALIKEAHLSKESSLEIAKEIEKKLFATGLQQVSTGLIRELVDNELLLQGYTQKLKRQRSLGIPRYDLEQLIFSKSCENSNIAAHNPEAINLGIAEVVLKQYALENIFSREVSQEHLSGRIHIHDLGYPTRVYCSSHSLEYIKKYGLDLANLEIISSPAKHARTLTGHLNTFLASMQAYYAGALGIGYLNIFYAPLLVGMTFDEMKQEAQYLIFSGSQNAFSRGGQTLFLDFNIHLGVPDYLKNVPAIGSGGTYTGKTYGEYEKVAQQFCRALMEVWHEGDAYGHVFAFPKLDLHIDERSFTDPVQRELLTYACEISSDNGVPYFIFDRGDGAILSQCCRLRERITDKYMIEHPESMRFCGFQNVTINLPQAAYRSKGSQEKFYEELDFAIEICIQAHLQKKEFIKKLMNEKGFPLWQLGKPAADGRPYVDIEKSTYIVGMIGLNECVRYLTGKQLHEDEAVFKLGLKIISYLYLKLKKAGEKYNMKFALEESPAESATRRLAKIDLREFPESKDLIKGNINTGEYYYTNSVHFAADAPISFVDRIIGQSKFHPIIESGAIIHAFVGEQKPNPKAIFNLIEKTWRNTSCAQLTISPEFTICNNCHRMSRGLGQICRYCNSSNVYGVTRIVGYFSRIQNWNNSKIGELKDRHKGNYIVE